MKKYFGGLFFITLSTLALQVAIIRYFSIALWSNYGYMVISIALFGFGVSGTILTMARKWFEKRLNMSMYIISLLVVPVTMGAYLLMQKVPFNALQIIDPNYTFKQITNLSLYFIILFVPFFLSGMYVGLSFLAHKNNVQKLYFYDMVGAGTGTILLLILMFIVHPAYLIIPIILLFFIGHMLTVHYKEEIKKLFTKIIISGLIFAISIIGISIGAKIEYSPQKDIKHTISSINARILAENYSPLGLLNIVKSTKERSAPGLSGMSYQMLGKMPDFRGIYLDGDQSSSIMSALNGSTIDAIKYLPQIAPYLIKKKPGVLILGMGGGRSLSVAYHSSIAINFMKNLKNIWMKKQIDEKVKKLRQAYRNPPRAAFKRLLDANRARFEKEAEEEWKKLMADDVNKVDRLKPFLNQAYELTVSKNENQGPRFIDAVELNGQLIKLLENDFSGFNGGLLYKRGVSVHQADLRGFLRRTDKKYDIIEMSLYLGGGMSTSGNLPSHENYLYTTHSIKDAFRRLSKNGILAMTIDAKESLRDALRLFTTAIKALNSENNLNKKFFIFRSMTTVTFLIKKSEYTEKEVETLKKFCTQNSFDVSYHQGIDPTGNREVNNEEYDASSRAGVTAENPNQNILKYSLYKIAIAKFINNSYESFLEKYPYNIYPVSDNRPYFSYKLKLGQTFKALFSGDFSIVPYQETNYLILWLNLALAIIFGVIIISLPLVKTIFNPNKRKDWQGGKMAMVGYFVCLGFGFLFVEMVLIQKFVLFLTNPIYSTSLVLAGVLTFSGLGSFYSTKLIDRFGDTKKVIMIAVSVICTMVFIYMFILDPIIRSLMFLPTVIKLIIALIFIAPIAFFLGMPFPLGLSEVNKKREDFLPWAWGINGATSVASTVLATILSIGLGFHGVWIIAIAIYGSSYFLFPGRIKY